MNKKLLTLILTLVFVVGGGIGAFGDHYYFIMYPEKKAIEKSNETKKKLTGMVRHGKVTEVKPSEITVSITTSGKDEYVGKTLIFTTDQYCNVQRGIENISKIGQQLDLTKFISVGQEVDIIDDEQLKDKKVVGHKAIAIHWDVPNQGPPVTGSQVPTAGISSNPAQNTPAPNQ